MSLFVLGVSVVSPHTGLQGAGGLADNRVMRVIPQEPLGVIEFAEARRDVWEPDPAQIGLTHEQVQALVDQMKTARESYDAAVRARAASVAATAAMRTQAAVLRGLTARLVATIKAFAPTGGPEGYPADQILAIAQIDVPGSGPLQATTGHAPGKPVRVSAMVTPSGGIRLSWRARDAAASTGAFFSVARRLAGEQGFTVIGTSPGLSRSRRRADFLDDGPPVGIASAAYQITGRRAGAVGEPSEVVSVTLGTVGWAASDFVPRVIDL